MNRPLIGIIGGIIIFLAILSLFHNNSDFDTQLIEQVNNGVPADELIKKIDKETDMMQIKARRRLESFMMDRKNWGNGSLALHDEYQIYISNYESEMKIISDYSSVRKKFAKREISRREFLDNIKILKEFFRIYYQY